jgi:hypothetical protein
MSDKMKHRGVRLKRRHLESIATHGNHSQNYSLRGSKDKLGQVNSKKGIHPEQEMGDKMTPSGVRLVVHNLENITNTLQSYTNSQSAQFKGQVTTNS